MENVMEKTGFEFPNETVLVKPNYENSGWVKNPRHAAFFKLEGCFDHYGVAMLKNGTGTLKNPLTKEELAAIAQALGLDEKELSVYTKGSYLRQISIKLGKDPVKFNLRDPLEYLRYKVLLTNTDKVAHSIKDKKNKATYKYFVEREKDVAAVNKEKANLNQTVWKEYGKMEDNKSKLAGFLKVYARITNQPAIKVDKNTKIEFLQGKVSEIIENNILKVYELFSNPDYEIILLISESMEIGKIEQKGTKYFLAGGVDKLGDNLKDTISFLKSSVNQELRLTLEEQIKSGK